MPRGRGNAESHAKTTDDRECRDLPCSEQAALDAIWQIKNIERTKVNADAADVFPEDSQHGSYRVWGVQHSIWLWGA